MLIKKSDHNVTVITLKCLRNKYAKKKKKKEEEEITEATFSSGIHQAKYHNGNSVFLFGMGKRGNCKVLKSHMNFFSHFEISTSLF